MTPADVNRAPQLVCVCERVLHAVLVRRPLRVVLVLITIMYTYAMSRRSPQFRHRPDQFRCDTLALGARHRVLRQPLNGHALVLAGRALTQAEDVSARDVRPALRLFRFDRVTHDCRAIQHAPFPGVLCRGVHPLHRVLI